MKLDPDRSFFENLIFTVLCKGGQPSWVDYRKSVAEHFEVEDLDAYINEQFRLKQSDEITALARYAAQGYLHYNYKVWKEKNNITIDSEFIYREFLVSSYANLILHDFYNGTSQLPVYRMGEELTKTLIEDDPDIPIDLFRRQNAQLLIEIPKSCQFNMQCGKWEPYARYAVFDAWDAENETRVNLSIFGISKQTGLISTILNTTISTKSEKEGALFGIDQDIKGSDKYLHINPIVRAFGQCAAYILSGEPDVRHYRVERQPTELKRRDRDRWIQQHRDDPVIEHFQVGFDWKKPRAYKPGQVPVRAHYRRQWCGKGRQELRWVFVKESLREYGVLQKFREVE